MAFEFKDLKFDSNGQAVVTISKDKYIHIVSKYTVYTMSVVLKSVKKICEIDNDEDLCYFINNEFITQQWFDNLV